MIKILEALCDKNLTIDPVIENRSPDHKKATDTSYHLIEVLEKKLNAEEREMFEIMEKQDELIMKQED